MIKLIVPELPSHSELVEIFKDTSSYENFNRSRDAFGGSQHILKEVAKPYRDALIVAVDELNDRCYCNDCDGGTCSTCKALNRIDALLNKDKEGEGK